MLAGQRGNLLGGGTDISLQFEADPCCSECLSVTVDEYRLVVRARLPLQQGFEEIHRFRPERAGALFPPFPHKAYVSRRFQTHRAWAQVEGFLNPRTGVVEQGEQGMVALAFDCGAVGLRQDGGDFVRLEIAELGLRGTLYRDAEHLSTLYRRQRFSAHEEAEEASESCQAAVSCSDRHLALRFAVLQKRQHLGRSEIRQTKSSDWLILRGGRMPEKQAPAIPIRKNSVMRGVALLDQPVMKEGVQQLRKRSLHHWAPPLGAHTANAPYWRYRPLACWSNSWVIVR
jgi:hypothetical protein